MEGGERVGGEVCCLYSGQVSNRSEYLYPAPWAGAGEGGGRGSVQGVL